MQQADVEELPYANENFDTVLTTMAFAGYPNGEAALVASIPMSGRAQIVYAQVHGQKRVGNRAAHRGFLEHLRQVLPTGRQIFVATDAGFGRSWFDDVAACGLHFVGRLTRNNTRRPHGAARALRVHDLFSRALGAGVLRP